MRAVLGPLPGHIVLALERFDVSRRPILAASQTAVSMVVQLEADGLEARFWTVLPSVKSVGIISALPTTHEGWSALTAVILCLVAPVWTQLETGPRGARRPYRVRIDSS